MSLLHSAVPFAIIWKAWGYSSAGRAFEWHSKGQRFDPAYLHHVFNPPHLSDVVLLFIPLTAVSDSLDFMRHLVPLKSVPYFAAASSHCFSSISQTLRFPGISDSLDFMRRFAPLESVPYLTGLISIIYITIKKVTSLRYGLFVLLNLLTRVKSEFESGGEHECPRHG